MASFDVVVIKDFVAKKIAIKIVNGGIDTKLEEVSFTAGDIIKDYQSVNPASASGHYNITLKDSSTIMDVPSTCVSRISPSKKGGCGGCGRRRS